MAIAVLGELQKTGATKAGGVYSPRNKTEGRALPVERQWACALRRPANFRLEQSLGKKGKLWSGTIEAIVAAGFCALLLSGLTPRFTVCCGLSAEHE